MKSVKKVMLAVCCLLAVCSNLAFAAKSKAKSKDKAPAAAEAPAAPKTGKGIRITVLKPAFEGETAKDSWMPQVFQDLLTSKISEYSEMTVIDRANQDAILKEQKEANSGAFSEENEIEIGNITNAQYVVVGKIINAGGQYSITFRVNDVSKNEVNASYSGLFSYEQSQNGYVVKSAVKDLLPKMGIDLSAEQLSSLSTEAMTKKEEAKVASTVNLAKGMAAETYSKNLVEAMAYYASSNATEAAFRYENLTNDVSTGNIREDAKNDIAQRKAWLRNYDDLQNYINNNAITVTYNVQPGETVTNYTTETLTIPFSYSWDLNPTVVQVYSDLEYGLEKTGKARQWSKGAALESGRSDFSIKAPSYTIYFKLVDTKTGKEISTTSVEANVSRYTLERLVDEAVKNKGKVEQQKKTAEETDEGMKLYGNILYVSGDSSSNSQTLQTGTIKFSNIPVEKVADNLSVGISKVVCNERYTSWRKDTSTNDAENPPIVINVEGQSKPESEHHEIIPNEEPYPWDPEKRIGTRGPAGGIIFWRSEQGVLVNGKKYHYMEMAPEVLARDSKKDLANSRLGLSQNSSTGHVATVGGTKIKNAIGQGIVNTNLLLAAAEKTGNSALVSQITSFNYCGYTDWFIPSERENAAMARYAYWNEYNNNAGAVLKKIYSWGGTVTLTSGFDNCDFHGGVLTSLVKFFDYRGTYLLGKYERIAFIRFF